MDYIKARLGKLVFLLVFLVMIVPETALGCTNFKVRDSDTILFGNSEDQSITITEVYITFIPSDATREYGAVHVGYDNKVASKIQGGMNDQGLAYDSTYVPPLPLNLHLERPQYQKTMGEIFLETCANISDVINTINQHQIPEGLDDTQWFFVDRNGDSLTVSPGKNGELIFTTNSEDYQAVSNHNIAIPSQPDEGSGKERKKIAESQLERATGSNDVSIDSAVKVLNSIHQEGADVNTVYSNIFDVTNLDIYLYYFHQFDDVIKLNLLEELNKGAYSVRIPDLFSKTNFENAQGEYNEYARTFPFDFLLFLLTIVIDAIVLVLVLAKLINRIRKKSKSETSQDILVPNYGQILRNYIVLSMVWMWNLLVPSMIYNNHRWQWPPKFLRYGLFEHFSLFILLSSFGPLIFFKVKLWRSYGKNQTKDSIIQAFGVTIIVDLSIIILTQFISFSNYYIFALVTFPVSISTLMLSDWMKFNVGKLQSIVAYITILLLIWSFWYLPLYFSSGIGFAIYPLLASILLKLISYQKILPKFIARKQTAQKVIV